MSNNHAPWEGGGIANVGATLNVINSTVSGNVVYNINTGYESHGEGGGVYSDRDGISGGDSQLSMTGCTLSNNRAGSEGGGIWVSYTRTAITGCTLSGNSATSGSAIYNRGSGRYIVIVRDSLFSGNSNSSYFPIYGQWLNGGGDTFK